jgi:cytochrome c biogenesis protein CcmG/thiol:disulfide interchange protein DsbE
MNHLWRGIVAAAMAASLASPCLAAAAKVGRPAPETTITLLDSGKVKLSELRGKVVVINHWATWCGPCKAEMPMMSAFHHRYKDAGFEIYGVTTEDSVEAYKLKKVSELLSYHLARRLSGDGYPLLDDGVPTSYVIDRAGIVRFAKEGAFDAQEFIDDIIPLLREPAPAN